MKFKMFNLALVTLCVIACSLSAASSVDVIKDVSYLGDDRLEQLDVYLPDGNSEQLHPAILLIHGGGWRVGDKASKREKSFANDLASEGYVVFSINYKLNVGERDPDTRKFSLSLLAWPQNLYDCKSALRYIRKEAGQYSVDPERIAVMGGSAGGHLSMLVAATASDDSINQHGHYVDQSNAVSCILNFYGEFDVRGQSVTPFMGASRSEKKEFETMASPVTYFTESLPPMLIVHGTGDETIPVERSRELVSFLHELGSVYEYIEVEGAPHGFDFQPQQRDLRPVVFEFLRKYL
jgi:acetyl esterase/lipase